MNRLLILIFLVGISTTFGCGRSNSSNIMDSADQKAIDDYDAEMEKQAEALKGYTETD